MSLQYFYIVFVLSTLVPLNVSKVIPSEHLKEEWNDLENYDDGFDQTTEVEEDDNHEEIYHSDISGGKFKKSKKKIPKLSIADTRFPDRPDLVLLALPSEFMSNERPKLLDMVEQRFGHLVDADVLKKVANGDTGAVPKIWTFLSNFNIKGAFTALLAEQFFKNFASANEHPVVPDLTREQCKKLCKDKEIELFQLINGALIRLTQTEAQENEDIRIRIRPSLKKCFKYEAADREKHSECTCMNVGKNIYVSPQLKKIINNKFFDSDEGEKEIKKLIEHTFVPEKEMEKNNSGWSFAKLGYAFLDNIGLGSEKRRAREPKRYDKNYFASKTEWILLNAVVNILILGFCFPLWPFHVMFFLIGWFFV